MTFQPRKKQFSTRTLPALNADGKRTIGIHIIRTFCGCECYRLKLVHMKRIGIFLLDKMKISEKHSKENKMSLVVFAKCSCVLILTRRKTRWHDFCHTSILAHWHLLKLKGRDVLTKYYIQDISNHRKTIHCFVMDLFEFQITWNIWIMKKTRKTRQIVSLKNTYQLREFQVFFFTKIMK